jgi:hypothetical protein
MNNDTIIALWPKKPTGQTLPFDSLPVSGGYHSLGVNDLMNAPRREPRVPGLRQEKEGKGHRGPSPRSRPQKIGSIETKTDKFTMVMVDG